ncbi:MAG TPA: tetratricopeptide repeat protein [Candidatus Polarisedimenticolia bacterium]
MRRHFIYPADMSAPPSIKSQQYSFAIAGVIFGFVMGFVAAYQFYGGRTGGVTAATAPETMGGQRPAMAGSRAEGMPPAQGGAGQMDGAPPQEMMEQVTRELEALKKAIEADPHNVTALGRLGNMYMDAGMFDRAIQYYTTALQTEPGNVDIRTDMGSCLRQMGKAKEALKAFEESISVDPKHWKSWFNVGVVCMYDLGDYDRAESAFAKVLELNPGSFDMKAVKDEIEKLKSGKSEKAQGSPS